MRRLPPLNALRAFEAAARCGSISAAAKELGVTHSAVSQQVLHLEQYFGQKLFHRPGKRIEATASALALLEDVRDALDRIAIASDQLNRRGLRRIITINAPHSFTMLWLMPRAAEFQEKHPHLELRASTSTGNCDALQLDGPYDFVIRRGPMARQGYICSKILDDAATPLMFPLSKLQVTRPEQLQHSALLHTRSWPDAWRRWFSQHATQRAETLDGSFFDHTALALQAAMNNLGAALAPSVLADEHIATGRLVAPFPGRTISGPGYHIMHPCDAVEQRGPREFLRFLELHTERRKDNVATPSEPQSAFVS
jgi:LysR family glycine cleavage system transcriptional activator